MSFVLRGPNAYARGLSRKMRSKTWWSVSPSRRYGSKTFRIRRRHRYSSMSHQRTGETLSAGMSELVILRLGPPVYAPHERLDLFCGRNFRAEPDEDEF